MDTLTTGANTVADLLQNETVQRYIGYAIVCAFMAVARYFEKGKLDKQIKELQNK